MSIPPGFPPNSSNYGPQGGPSQDQIDAIEAMLQKQFGQGIEGAYSPSSQFPPALKQQIVDFQHAKTWHDADFYCQKIINTLQGISGDSTDPHSGGASS
jgi:hypothetical protein